MNEQQIDRDRLRELAENATPGPWEADQGMAMIDSAVRIPHWAEGHETPGKWVAGEVEDRTDAAFIAAARTAVPPLLDQLDRAEAEQDQCIRLIGVLAEQVAAREASLDQARAALDRVRAHLIRCADEYGDEVYQGNGWAEGVRDAAREALKELDGQR